MNQNEQINHSKKNLNISKSTTHLNLRGENSHIWENLPTDYTKISTIWNCKRRGVGESRE